MKNGEAILNAMKLLGKELSIGLKEEGKVLRSVAEKVVDSYKDGTLAGKAKSEIEKDAAIAGEFISAQVANIGKELDKAKEQAAIKRQAKEAAAEVKEEDIIDAEPVEEVPAEEVCDSAEPEAEPVIFEVIPPEENVTVE